MKPSEDEIIAHIKDSLATYEEAYVPGSWEKFSKHDTRKPGLILWLGRITSAAAVVLIGTLLFWFSNRDAAVIPDKVAKTTPQDVAVPRIDSADPAPHTEEAGNVMNEQGGAEGRLTTSYHAQNVTPEPSIAAVAEITESTNASPSTSNIAIVTAGSDNPVSPKTEATAKQPSIEEFLKNESSKTAQISGDVKEAVRKDNKWEVGVVVSPSFGNTKRINMGYGVSMGYSLSDKVSLNSGLSYNEMAASRSVGQTVAAGSAIAGEHKSLESIEQKVTGIDIPLDIKYNISKNLYANVGVSAFAVIDQRQNNNYVQERLVERSYASPAGGKEYNTLIINEKVTENAPPSEIDKNNYIGFYNFSFGYKQKVAKDKSISIEPFMKVPMKEVTKDNLRLMGTGFKLRFDF